MKISFFFLLMLFLSFGKNAVALSNECNLQLNDSDTNFIDTLQIKKILILGNSITYHSKDLTIGWSGDWGMAASSLDSDYVHILKRKFTLYDPTISLSVGGISNTFERKFWKMDSSDFVKFKSFNADLVILKIGENVNDSIVKANVAGFERDIEQLVQYVTTRPRTKICLVGSFWPNKFIDKSMENVCKKNNWLFVSLNGIYQDRDKNTAAKLFTNKGIGAHPSDAGMRSIAIRIWNKIEFMFNKKN